MTIRLPMMAGNSPISEEGMKRQLGTYRGKLISELSREELIEALIDTGERYKSLLEDIEILIDKWEDWEEWKL